MDPRRAGHRVERAAGVRPLARRRMDEIAPRRPRVARRGVGRRRRLPRGDPRRRSSRSSACRCSTTYGLSEAPTVVTIDDRDGTHVPGASGRPLPHLDVQIIDDEVCVARRHDRARGRARTTRCSATGERPDATGDVAARRRSCTPAISGSRRRRLSPHPRPQEPRDHPRRCERVPGGGRAGPARARRGGRVRGGRRRRRPSRRTGGGRGRARARRDA